MFLSVEIWLRSLRDISCRPEWFLWCVESSFCAAIYIRVISNSSVVTSLLTAKCRLVPMKDHSILRLELLACLLLSSHMNTVTESISKQIKIHRIYCWTDSQMSLWSIRQQAKTWKIWIQNRVNKIRNVLPINSWKFIRTNENPPDIGGTRRTQPDVLLNKTLWRKSPSLLNSLHYSFDSYCVCCEGKDACSFVECEISGWKPGDETDVEDKRIVVAMKGATKFVSGIGAIFNVKGFSCGERIVWVAACVGGLVRNCLKGWKKSW